MIKMPNFKLMIKQVNDDIKMLKLKQKKIKRIQHRFITIAKTLKEIEEIDKNTKLSFNDSLEVSSYDL